MKIKLIEGDKNSIIEPDNLKIIERIQKHLLENVTYKQSGEPIVRKAISILFTIITFGMAAHCLAINKTITRTEDPITITGKELEEYTGSNPDDFALLIYKDGKFKPIPFQIDQVKADGLYALQFGDTASTDTDPNLDENDELTFMINDLGGKAPFNKKPVNAEFCKELEVTDPTNDKKGWAYLCTYKDNPPRSEIDYVNLTFEDKYIIYNLIV